MAYKTGRAEAQPTPVGVLLAYNMAKEHAAAVIVTGLRKDQDNLFSDIYALHLKEESKSPEKRKAGVSSYQITATVTTPQEKVLEELRQKGLLTYEPSGDHSNSEIIIQPTELGLLVGSMLIIKEVSRKGKRQ